MTIDVVVTLPDGHTWQGELDIDAADLEVGEPGEEEIDLDDDEVRAHIFDCISEWLLQEKIGWVWAVKPDAEPSNAAEEPSPDAEDRYNRGGW